MKAQIGLWLFCVMSVAVLFAGPAQAAMPAPTGVWDFIDPNVGDPLAATVGNPLVLNPTGSFDSHTGGTDSYILIGPGSNLRCDHDIAPDATSGRVGN